MRQVHLATEDALSEAVGRRLILDLESGIEVGLQLRRGGNGHLRSNLDKFIALARRDPVLLITDLDRQGCAASLRRAWIGARRLPDTLIFRVAVREIEAWLLADHQGVSQLMGGKVTRLPPHPDGLADPKRTLLDLASRASQPIKADLVAPKGALATQGLGYNNRLSQFAQSTWSPTRAAERSESLRRARCRLALLAQP
jgi:hypothetical protein